MKITKAFLPLGLTLAVAVSVALSAMIWTNPAQYERSRQRSSNTPTTELNTRPQKDVYLPTQVVSTDANGNQELLNNRKVNLTTEVREALSKWDLGGIRSVRTSSQADYLRYLTTKNSLLLSYSAPVNVKLFNTVFGSRLARLSTEFSRIMIPLDNTKALYLLNDRGQKVYRVTVRKSNLGALRKILKENLFRINVKMQWLNHSVMPYVTNTVTVQAYSYLVNQQSTDYFTTRLLNKGESTNVSAKKNKDNTIYSDGASRQLTVYDKRGTALYEDYSALQSSFTFSQALTASYNAVKSIGIPMENLRYYGYTKGNSTVTYRSFVEGFPIFNQSNYGAARIQMLSQGVRRYNFSLYSLQVPVPTDKKAESLPSTQRVIDLLLAAGYDKKKIVTVQLGYQWLASSSSDKVVNLTPTWYIYYRGSGWKTYDQLLKQQQ
ncbi:MAG: two-component system activity regulator YycH [Levilactobacillus sp.]|jgi:regulatory protein YycH of two-component signal transduction system YycFG|uniref:YycH family regulatory protein n=1 Tax=Levilactobacillus sp. TaxID=2767919 RepID=UPI0025882CF7|nr:two-component system activity regulator YycH [Levilactobacillus sp.]MCI1554371.1 two-component system activity regulator YycH [Levilactobacillus sp.]MCI1598298.1 two-component system activity regulator YycH [Levilactobacillus sp.]MCI1605345.1 two-component system activity regulator YycH [Levilactobacillus sp.]